MNAQQFNSTEFRLPNPGEVDGYDLLSTYLRNIGLIEDGEAVIKTSTPGEGNMNRTLRVQTKKRSFIMKQANAWVEKYPQVAAPRERALSEAAFYNQIKDNYTVAQLMPGLLKLDSKNYILAIEDLGTANDFTSIYDEGTKLSAVEVKELSSFLTALHSLPASVDDRATLQNKELRLLNHEHIFVFPFTKSHGLNLDNLQPGLAAIALPFVDNEELKNKASRLGEQYLSDGLTLLHGDFYPGSWLRTSSGTKVIDPEFCFYGHAEFDLGVCIAHLHLSGQDQFIIDSFVEQYKKPADFKADLFSAFTAIEIIRRLIGLAQLPLKLSIENKKLLLEKAANFL